MFDSKKILDALLQGAMQPQGAQSGGGGLGDLLGQVLAGGKGGAAPQAGGGGLGDLLGQVLAGGKGGAAPQAGGGGLGDLLGQVLAGGKGGAAPQAGGGGLGDLLGQVLGGGQQAQAPQKGGGGLGDLLGGLLGGGQQPTQGQTAAPGGLGDLVGSILGQAAGGARDAARDANAATGASDMLGQLIEQATGKKLSPDMLNQIQEMIANNQLAAGAAAGGLGGLLLGTKSGRNITATAAKLGGMALIAGLAYKAYNNYIQGKPLIKTGEAVTLPPKNSAFHPDAGDVNQNATLMLRGMIAAAMSDGKLEEAEKKVILGSLEARGLDQDAVDFINQEIASPADIASLAEGVQGPEQATALYTACRLAIDVNNKYEKRFMEDLAESLGLDDVLKQQVESAAVSVRPA